jgi:hypothetical protein
MVAFAHIAYADQRRTAWAAVGRSFGLLGGGYWINFGICMFAALVICLWSFSLSALLAELLALTLSFFSDSYSYESLRLLNVFALMLTGVLWNLGFAVAMTVTAVNYYNAVEQQEFVQLKRKIDTVGTHLLPQPETPKSRKLVL